MKKTADALRIQIRQLVAEYYAIAFEPKPFVPGQSAVPVSGKCFDERELQNLVDSSLDFWLTTGRFAASFEREFAKYWGLRFALLVNSGSSANLLALTALTSPLLGDRCLKPGDEVITSAAGFPTTVNPIIQNGLVPVFVDAAIPTYGIDISALEHALSDRTRVIMLAHTLGNPFNLDVVAEFARKHDLWLIEDCCDAVGATYRGKHVGLFGDIATVSFYPAHHITMGEGGCVLTNNPILKKSIESFRDWGRDCWCEPGKDNTCGKRFEWQLGDLPLGYDHKYTYSHVGYNLKATDMQASVGLAQLDKIDEFIELRRRNFALLYQGLSRYQDILILPEAEPHSQPSWFGFPITVRANMPFSRFDLVRHLEANRIATRQLFAGNLIRQPAYKHLNYRVVGDLAVADQIMNNTFWIGVFPAINEQMIEYMVNTIGAFLAEHPRR